MRPGRIVRPDRLPWKYWVNLGVPTSPPKRERARTWKKGSDVIREVKEMERGKGVKKVSWIDTDCLCQNVSRFLVSHFPWPCINFPFGFCGFHLTCSDPRVPPIPCCPHLFPLLHQPSSTYWHTSINYPPNRMLCLQPSSSFLRKPLGTHAIKPDPPSDTFASSFLSVWFWLCPVFNMSFLFYQQSRSQALGFSPVLTKPPR